MKKLNNHGLTAVEVIICFSITAVIVVSLFKTINNFNEKQYLESKKSQIKLYENTVTKTIQDNILKNGGLWHVELSKEKENKIYFTFNNNRYATLEIHYDSDENEEKEFIYYESGEEINEKFYLEEVPDVKFNEPRIDYDEDNGILNIYVGIIDIDLGDKYSVLDLHLPISKKWGNVY